MLGFAESKQANLQSLKGRVTSVDSAVATLCLWEEKGGLGTSRKRAVWGTISRKLNNTVRASARAGVHASERTETCSVNAPAAFCLAAGCKDEMSRP